MGKRNYFEIKGLLDMPESVSYDEVVDKFIEWVESLGGFATVGWSDVTKEAREMNGEVEDDFPNCSISGCEGADATCHLTCPYSKELADLKRDTIARLKEKGIDVYIYAMEYDEDGTPYFAFTFDKDKVVEAKEIWEDGGVLNGCYDEYIYGDLYDCKLDDMCRTITHRYEMEMKK